MNCYMQKIGFDIHLDNFPCAAVVGHFFIRLINPIFRISCKLLEEMVKGWLCCTSQPKVRSPTHEEPSQSWPLPSMATTSSPPPSMDSMELSIQKVQQVDPTDQIDPLIRFIEYQLQKLKGLPEEASTSLSSLDSVASNTRLASDFVEEISNEALRSRDMAEEMGKLTLSGLKMVGEAHWLFLGLSVAAYALERFVTVRSNVSDCIELMQKIVFLAKDLKQIKLRMPEERERLCLAVQIIVEGAIICCDYTSKGRIFRYWSAPTAKAQLKKIGQRIGDIRSALGLAVTLRQFTFHSQQSPFKLLDFEPVGIEREVAKVMELLDMEGGEPALAVVLCGFGGVGKSTLAASAIQSLNLPKLRVSQDLNFCRVIINYKTPERESHIIELQQYIITAFGGYKFNLQNPAEGRKELQQVMENKFCFLYIDNVVDKEYIRQLLPKDLLWFNKSDTSMENLEKQKTKLRILVTSREKNLKPEFNINCKEYEVHAFSDDAAEELLIGKILQSHGQISVDFDERSLMTSVARACRGVPLILSVFGNHLRAEREEGVEQAEQSYREAIEALEKGNLDSFRDEDISESLFFVYHKLRDEEDKDAFLDICKYFYGWEWNLVGNIVDPSRLQSLHRRMLINKSDSGEVIVHDILRLMGVKEAKQTRISNYIEFSEVFEDGEVNLQMVKGISLVSDKAQIKLELKHLDAVRHSLRVLMIGDWVKIDGLPCNRAFKNLRYLSVGDVTYFPFEDASKLQKLTVFFNKSKHGMNLHQLPRSLKFISQEVADPDCHSFEILPLQRLHSLQNLIVRTRKPVKLPEEFHLPSSIVHLQLNCCSQLPNEFSNLTALESLVLDKCDLESLPQGFRKLKKLKHLSMEYCTKLTSLPEELGLLSSMTSLRLHGCTLLKKLPVDLGKLSGMEELSMGECKNLRELPRDFGGLSSLQKLDLTGCISLQRLPESFEKLLIESLTLQLLPNLYELPASTGNMPRLTHLKLISCNSLTTLPNSFVQLSSLETLEIDSCNKLVALPRDFGQLSSLQEMAVRSCPKMEELPHGFQALPALKSFTLAHCSSLLNLPAGFGELICLEILDLVELPISILPDGFGKLKRLEKLDIYLCHKLETLPDDFESLASLSRLRLWSCTKLDGRAMERIVKLKLCYWVIIAKSFKLIERWDEMREEEEYPMVVSDGIRRGEQLQYLLLAEGIFSKVDEEELCRAAKVGLLGARCVQLDITTQRLMERSTSILFEVDTTVAVIALPVHMEDRHHQLIERFIGVVMEKTKLASSGHLQIVFVKRIKHKGEMTETEKQEEEDCFRQILMSMPKGSCCIPSTDMRCHRLITFILFESRRHDLYPVFDYTADNKLGCRMLKTLVNNKGNKILQFNNFFGEDEIFGESLRSSESVYEEHEISNSNGNFIEYICSGKLPGTAGPSRSQAKESMLTEFLQILKENNACNLIDSELNKVDLDQLKGNVVGIFICDRNTHEYEKFHHIYEELGNRSFNFKVLWIPLSENEFYGLGTYTRAIQKMAWTALPDPNLVKVKKREPHFIIFDQEGSVVNSHALSPMMSWGAEAYPFSQSKISEIVSTMQVEFSLNFLFNRINLVDKEVIKNKLIFLYAEPPSQKLEMKFKLDQLAQLHGNFEIIYVGYYFLQRYDVLAFKEIYEDVIKNMNWPKLSFEDMVTFWYRCKYLFEEMKERSNLITEEFKILLEALYFEKGWLVVLDINGVVTRNGYEVVKMICEKNDEKRGGVHSIMKNELLESLKLGKCNQVVKTYFADIIINHPDHLQHQLVISSRLPEYVCNSCYYSDVITWDRQWRYRCDNCDWDLCKKCWKLFVKRQMQDLFLAKDMDMDN